MSLLASHVRRTKRNRVITAGVLIGAVIAVGAVESRYFLNCFTGPRETTAAELASAQSAADLPRYYVRVHASEVTDTGYDHITREVDKDTGAEISSKTDGSYVLLAVGDKYLLAKTPDRNLDTLTGPLYDAGALDSVDRQIYTTVLRDNPDLRGQLVPMMLDGVKNFTSGGTVAVIGSVLALALAAWHLARSRRARVDVRGTTEDVHASLDAELAMADATRIGSIWMTGSWLLHRSWYRVTAVPYEHLVWAYKMVTRHKRAFITVSKDYEVKLYDRDGKLMSVKIDEMQVDWVLDTLSKRAPWVILGHSAELEHAFRRNRAQLIAVVDARMAARDEAA